MKSCILSFALLLSMVTAIHAEQNIPDIPDCGKWIGVGSELMSERQRRRLAPSEMVRYIGRNLSPTPGDKVDWPKVLESLYAIPLYESEIQIENSMLDFGFQLEIMCLKEEGFM